MYQVYLADHFLRQLKPYLKKFPHFQDDLEETLKNFIPSHAISLGGKLYKARLKSRDLPRGKSKSFRLIIFVLGVKELLVPIMVYYKSERENVSVKEIEYHLAVILEEVRKKKF